MKNPSGVLEDSCTELNWELRKVPEALKIGKE
jgi:hypothetical protein